MAYRTSSNIMDALIEGQPREWFVHRYKRALDGAAGPYPQLGTALDEGFDVPITGISVLSAGTAGVCELPTEQSWSTTAGAMEFMAYFVHTGAGVVPADLEVDVEFYECAWGDSGQPERWEFLHEYSFRDGDQPIKIVTDGKQIFARISDIDNPDPQVSMQLLCRMADGESGAGGSSGEGPATNWKGVEAIGNLIWDNAQRKWTLWHGTEADGALVKETNSTDILTELLDQGSTLDAIDVAVTGAGEDTANALAGLAGVWAAPHDFTAAYLGAGGLTITIGDAPLPVDDSQWIGTFEKTDDDAIIFWAASQYEHTYSAGAGELYVEGATFEATSTFRPMYVSHPRGMGRHDGVPDRYVSRTGYVANAGIPAAVDDGDDVEARADLTGSAGVHLTNGLDHTTSSVETWEQPATGSTSGSQAISNAGATALNGGTSLPCIYVVVQNRVGNGPIAMGDAGIAGVNEGTILQAGASVIIDIDDVAKLYGYATNNNDPIDWWAFTR